MTSNVERGAAFVQLAKLELERRFGFPLQAEVPIAIGEPPKPHRFDLANEAQGVAVECKAFTWTASGRIPSAKITTVREAILYLQHLPDEWTKVIAMARDTHRDQRESLATYFVRLNRHLLGDVGVFEVRPGLIEDLTS